MKEKLLIIDDEQRNDSFYQNALSEHFDITLDHQGRMDFAKQTQANYAAIIIDIFMPVIDGFQLAQKFREQGVNSPILFISATNDVQIIRNGLKFENTEFLQFDMSKEELVQRVMNFVERSKRKTDDVVEFSGLQFNLPNMKVAFSGEEIPLTSSEFKILYCFAHKKSPVVSREDLVSFVWGSDLNIEDNNLNTHLSNLRKKMGACPLSIKRQRNQGIVLTEKTFM